MSETTKHPSITDGKLRIWTEDDATMHGDGHVTPTQFYERVRDRKFYSAQIERSEDEGDWVGHLMKDGWVVANSPMGGEVYMPMPKEMAALAAEVERLRAALERLMAVSDAEYPVIPQHLHNATLAAKEAWRDEFTAAWDAARKAVSP